MQPLLPRHPLRHDDAMDAAVAILIQVVNWPLAALVAWRVATRRVPAVAGIGVAVLLALTAVVAWDPETTAALARTAVVLLNMTLAVLLAVYPDGRVVPRWIIVPAGVEIAVQVGDLFSGLRWEQVQPWWSAHFLITWGVMLLGGQLYRYVRRSSTDERERTRWPLLGLVTVFLAFTLWSIAAAAGAASLEAPWLANLLLGIPAPMFAVGLLAPSILSVDRLLRFVVRWGLWAVVVATAAWLTGLMTIGMDARAAAWSVGIVAAVIGVPAAIATRGIADVVVLGRRPDPLRSLGVLGARLETTVDPRAVASEVVSTLTQELGLTGAALRGEPWLAAASGADPGADAAAFPIWYQGELLGELVVAPRAGEGKITPGDRIAVEQICRQAAPALHGARVMGQLIDARARVVHAREDERKRLRRDLHDELAPTFAGLGLSAAAVEALARAGDDRAANAAAALVAGLNSATRQLREVAYDLRPPVLDDRGLIAAIEDRVVTADAVPIVRLEAPPGRLELRAAVELAALRIAQEAVMNVRRHAAASDCIIRLQLVGDALRVSISDDGRGMPDQRRDGVGMKSMRERAEELGGSFRVDSRRGGGTVIEVSLPLVTRPITASTSALGVIM